MRVLMTTDTVGGVWTYAQELVGALAPHGVEVTLATMEVLEWMPEPWLHVDADGERLLELAERIRPDIVHINGYAHAALPFNAPVVCVAHSCVLTWHRAVRDREAGPEWNEYRRRAKAGLEAADVVVGPTQTIIEDVLAAHGVTRPGQVIYNGRDASRWQPGHKLPFVLAAGRLWDEAKGLATLAEAARDVRWPIAVAGPTKMPGRDEDARASGVQMLGQLSPRALAERMGRAAIYALPARYEPFGLSILEAALAGCALVLGDLRTLREVWGDTAVYVDPNDPPAVAATINKVSEDPGALAARSYARALTLTAGRMASSYAALYRGLLREEAWAS